MSNKSFAFALLVFQTFSSSWAFSPAFSNFNFSKKCQLELQGQLPNFKQPSSSQIAVLLLETILQSTIECSNSTEIIKNSARECQEERNIIRSNELQNKDWATSCKFPILK